MKRILTAIVLVLIVLGLLWFAPPQVFILAVVTLAGLAALEAYGILAERGVRPLRLLGAIWAVLIAGTFSSAGIVQNPLAVLTLGAIVVAVTAIFVRPDPEAILDTIQATLLPAVFIALPLGHLLALRTTGDERGRDLLLLLLLCVYLADTAAYYVGSAIGRRRMAPRLSPKKSWEGAIAAFVASIAAAVGAHFTFFPELPVIHAIAIGALLGPAGMLGDLMESVLKRAAGVKDSGSFLPGHGGLLDRIDSLLFATPVLYYFVFFSLGTAS